jgi:hypothetical protein
MPRTKVDTPAKSLEDLDVARRRAPVVPIIEGGSSGIIDAQRSRSAHAGGTRGHLGDSGHEVVDVEVKNAVVHIHARVRRGGDVQQRREDLGRDGRLRELGERREGVLVGGGEAACLG